jgi:hypothetical protein
MSIASLQRARHDLLAQMSQLGPMRRGTVSLLRLPRRTADGIVKRRGPYPTYTFKRNGKTVGRHLRSAEEAELYESQIAEFRRFEALAAKYADVSQELADAVVAGDESKKRFMSHLRD